MAERIYITEDDDSIRELVTVALSAYSYEVESFVSAEDCLAAAEKQVPDIFLFDIMLPGMDGVQAVKILRENEQTKNTPILMLTAKSAEIDKVFGLENGADDYLTKPFRPTILLMKVKALLRRVEMDRGKTAAAEDELHYGDIRYSATENAVLCGSTIVALTQTELRLLSYMMKQPEKAYSREELLSAVWGFDSEVETRVTDETLRRIRKKLLQAGSTVSVSTIWGFGYKLKGAERT